MNALSIVIALISLYLLAILVLALLIIYRVIRVYIDAWQMNTKPEKEILTEEEFSQFGE